MVVHAPTQHYDLEFAHTQYHECAIHGTLSVPMHHTMSVPTAPCQSTCLTHHLMRRKSMVSNPRIGYKSEFSNLV